MKKSWLLQFLTRQRSAILPPPIASLASEGGVKTRQSLMASVSTKIPEFHLKTHKIPKKYTHSLTPIPTIPQNNPSNYRKHVKFTRMPMDYKNPHIKQIALGGVFQRAAAILNFSVPGILKLLKKIRGIPEYFHLSQLSQQSLFLK